MIFIGPINGLECAFTSIFIGRRASSDSNYAMLILLYIRFSPPAPSFGGGWVGGRLILLIRDSGSDQNNNMFDIFIEFIWLKYCPFGVKRYSIIQAIDHSIKTLIAYKGQQFFFGGGPEN